MGHALARGKGSPPRVPNSEALLNVRPQATHVKVGGFDIPRETRRIAEYR